MRRALVAGGADVLEHSPVDALIRDRSTWIVESRSVTRRADAVVLAARGRVGAAARSPRARGCRSSRPRATAARIPSDPSGPRHALYLEAPKVAISVFDGAVRVSGTLELGARGLGLSDRRLEAITAAARQALPGWQMPARPRDWAGMRSLTPDGLPFIGPVPGWDGIHLAAGHATLGITLAPLTGELVAEQLLEGRRERVAGRVRSRRARSDTGGYLPRRLRATTGGLR